MVDKYGNTIDYVRLHSDQDSDGDDIEHIYIYNTDDIEYGNRDNDKLGCNVDHDNKTCEAVGAVRNIVLDERTSEKHIAKVDTELTNMPVETALKESENQNQES